MMTILFRRALLAGGLALLPTPLTAQTGDAGAYLLEPLIVSANRMPTDRAKIGSAVTVITREQIDGAGPLMVRDYLDRVPGLNFTQNGPAGTTTTLQMRGAYASYVLVRIDGIDVSDPSGSQNAAALEHLLLGDVERIEILPGSQSALYGGTAVGGVIDITTRTATRPGVHHTTRLEAGSYGTISGRHSVSARSGDHGIALTAERLRSDGFSAANRRHGNREADGYDNTSLSASASSRISEQVELFAAGRYTKREVAFDDFTFGVGPSDEKPGAPGNRTAGEDLGGRAGINFDLFGDRLSNSLALQYYRTDRETRGSNTSYYQGERHKFEYLGHARISDGISLSFGADHGEEIAESRGGLNGSITNTGLFSQLSIEPVSGVTLTGALRNDHHSRFGDHATHRLTAAWEVLADTKLRASWSSGFRPPSVFELFAATYGNDALKPEQSNSWDIGIDQRLWDGRASLSATWFQLDTSNLIQFAYDPAARRYRYQQIAGTTERQGLELSGRLRAFDWLELDAGYAWTDTARADGSRLARVPRHKITLGGTVTPLAGLSVAVMGTWVTGLPDTDYGIVDAQGNSPLRDLPSYFLLDLTARYQLRDGVELSVRGRNLLDQRYETVWGYGTAGASLYAGVTLSY